MHCLYTMPAIYRKMKFFKLTTNSHRFAFIESEKNILVYRLEGNCIEKISSFKFDKLKASLEDLKKNHPEIQKSNNSWILGSARSEILTIEKAPLNKQELFEYARWKIQEMIEFPIDDAAYDILSNNSLKHPYFGKYLTAVVTKKSVQEDIANTFKHAKVPLATIDSLQTSFRDVFMWVAETNNNKPLAFLKFNSTSVQINIYLEAALVLSRHVELPRLSDFRQESSEEDKEALTEKLILELQRTIDLLDRQHDIHDFEYIYFSSPKNKNFHLIEEKICDYFSLKSLSGLESVHVYEMKNEESSLEIQACFLRGTKISELINLIPQTQKESSLTQDLKKVVMFASLAGVVLASIGSFYEYKVKQLVAEQKEMKEGNDKLSADIEKLKSAPVSVDTSIQKDVNDLLQTKDSLLQYQNNKSDVNTPLYPKFMYELAMAAKEKEVYLTKLQFTQTDLYLEGYCLNKLIFSQFIQELQKSSSVNGKFLKSVSLAQDAKTNRYNFVISSYEQGETHSGTNK